MTADDLYLIIGVKEVELISLRQQVQKLQADINGWQAEAQRLNALLDDNIRNNGLIDADTAVLHRP